MDVSSLLRYLSEIPWFPTAFLNEDRVRWEAVDVSRALFWHAARSGAGNFSNVSEYVCIPIGQLGGLKKGMQVYSCLNPSGVHASLKNQFRYTIGVMIVVKRLISTIATKMPCPMSP